jgi:hypothetical protein
MLMKDAKLSLASSSFQSMQMSLCPNFLIEERLNPTPPFPSDYPCLVGEAPPPPFSERKERKKLRMGHLRLIPDPASPRENQKRVFRV